jgi:Rad3-related DNA helicase
VSYAEFIAKKDRLDKPSGFDPGDAMTSALFPFQKAIVRWACRRGRAAIWADCGLGKTLMALDWARLVTEHVGGSAIILTPLAVAEQFAEEGRKFGIAVNVCKSGEDLRPGINVTNYERIHRFDLSQMAAVVLDESSILKDYSSATRGLLIDTFAKTPYRLACTATPDKDRGGEPGVSKATLLSQLGYDPEREATQCADEAATAQDAQQQSITRSRWTP